MRRCHTKCVISQTLRMYLFFTATKTQSNAIEPTANANRISANSGGGESTNIFALIFDKTLVTNSGCSLLPCKSQSRTVLYPLASHRWNNDLTKSVTDFQDPLTRTHHLLPPYCLSSLPRSSYHTKHTACIDSADWTTQGCALNFSYSVHRREAGLAEFNQTISNKAQLNVKSWHSQTIRRPCFCAQFTLSKVRKIKYQLYLAFHILQATINKYVHTNKSLYVIKLCSLYSVCIIVIRIFPNFM